MNQRGPSCWAEVGRQFGGRKRSESILQAKASQHRERGGTRRQAAHDHWRARIVENAANTRRGTMTAQGTCSSFTDTSTAHELCRAQTATVEDEGNSSQRSQRRKPQSRLGRVFDVVAADNDATFTQPRDGADNDFSTISCRSVFFFWVYAHDASSYDLVTWRAAGPRNERAQPDLGDAVADRARASDGWDAACASVYNSAELDQAHHRPLHRFAGKVNILAP